MNTVDILEILEMLLKHKINCTSIRTFSIASNRNWLLSKQTETNQKHYCKNIKDSQIQHDKAENEQEQGLIQKSVKMETKYYL